MGPAAKILLRQYNINASKVGATGPHGILLKRYLLVLKDVSYDKERTMCLKIVISSDVMKYIKEKDLKPVQVEQTSPKPPMEAPKVAPSEPLPLGVSFSQMPVDHSRTNYKKLVSRDGNVVEMMLLILRIFYILNHHLNFTFYFQNHLKII